MANLNEEQPVSAVDSSGCNRTNVRNGMKMVIDDRIHQANTANNSKPIDELLSYINFNYQNGFTVTMIVKSVVVIDGEAYSGKDELWSIKDEGQMLFLIYRDHTTREWKLFYDEFNLLCEEEKTFYMMIDSILSEPKLEEV